MWAGEGEARPGPAGVGARLITGLKQKSGSLVVENQGTRSRLGAGWRKAQSDLMT